MGTLAVFVCPKGTLLTCYIVKRSFINCSRVFSNSVLLKDKRLITLTCYNNTCNSAFSLSLLPLKIVRKPEKKADIFLAKKLHSSALILSSVSYTSGMELSEVVKVLNTFALPQLAEGWDNVGLLTHPTPPHEVKHLFLTNDLTEKVLNEAIHKQANMILSYHPPIFSSMKRFTQDEWKHRILVKAIEHRIAIYSPHTSYDVIQGGVNDWLISCFEGDVVPIVPTQLDNTVGAGRICRLHQPLSVNDVVAKIKLFLGLKYIRVAFGCKNQGKIENIACCAGSGSSILKGVSAGVYLTGEMSHHEILDAVSNNVTVILCEHSNSERGFMKNHVKTLTHLLDNKVSVIMSENDADPVTIV